MLLTGDDCVMSRADSRPAHDTCPVTNDTRDGAKDACDAAAAAADDDDDDGECVALDTRRLFTDSRPAGDTHHAADDAAADAGGTPRLFIDSHASDDVADDADDDDARGCGLFAAAFSNNDDSAADNSSAGNAFFFCPEGFNTSVADTSVASDGGGGFPFSFSGDVNQSSTSDEDNPFTLIF